MRNGSICMLIFVLFAGRYFFIRAQTSRFEVTEGGNVTVTCQIYFFGNSKIFCKTNCNKKENILVQTAGASHQNGRYSIQHNLVEPYYHKMSVSITGVHRTDAGLYLCGLEHGQRNATMVEFKINVSKAPTSSYPAVTFRTNCSKPQTYNVSNYPNTQAFSTSSPSDQQQQSPTTGLIPYVAMLAALFLLIVALCILCRKIKDKKSKEPRGADFDPTSETEDSYKAIYSDLRFNMNSGPSLTSAHQCQTEAVVYAIPQFKSKEAWVYTTVNLPQH